MFTINVNSKKISFTFRHTRDCNFVIKPGKVVTDVTSCLLELDDLKVDTLSCCLAGDQFNKERGRKIALRRALDETTLSRAERRAVWEAYFNRANLQPEPKIESLMKYASGLQLEDEYDQN